MNAEIIWFCLIRGRGGSLGVIKESLINKRLRLVFAEMSVLCKCGRQGGGVTQEVTFVTHRDPSPTKATG